MITALDAVLGPHFFPERGDGKDPRLCPVCGAGRLNIKLGRFGAFIGCSNYPECKHTRPLAIEGAEGEGAQPREIGVDAATKLPVSLKKGPYGFYVQLGEGEGEEKPKRASVPKNLAPGDIDLDRALKLLALPRDIGPHPEDGEMIVAAIGRFGPYIKHGKNFRSVPKDDDVLTIGLNRAVSLLAEPRAPRRGAPTPLKSLGGHPADGAPVNLFNGRYGPYVSHGGINATVPRDIEPEALTLDQAVELLAARPQNGKNARRARGAAANKTNKKGTAALGQKTTKKSSTKKKPAPRKAAAAAS
ncbi:MAG: topoisomerase C-terminal repeat-containing protein [Stellaceae bacterium]